VRILQDPAPPAEVVTQAAPPSALTETAAPAPPETAAPAPPPAARIVVEGQRSEREIDLESELQAERDRHATTAAEKRSQEFRIAELEQERGELRAALTPPPAAPKKSIMEKFMAGEAVD
jgi:hypothetical protein